MSTVPTLPGITSKMIDTARLKTHVLFSGPEDDTPVLFIHGNASSNTYWEELMLKLPDGFRGIAPDLRGYGDTEDKLIDAPRHGRLGGSYFCVARCAQDRQDTCRRPFDGGDNCVRFGGC